jgi:hypothetical protein
MTLEGCYLAELYLSSRYALEVFYYDFAYHARA